MDLSYLNIIDQKKDVIDGVQNGVNDMTGNTQNTENTQNSGNTTSR